MRLGIIAVLVFLAGCESMPRGEMYWQGLHAIDVAQTYRGAASDDCYKEVNPITRRLIGEKPSKGEVLAWGVGSGLIHYGVSSYLEDNAPGWVFGAWQLVSTGSVAVTISNNYDLGIRVFGDNDHSKLEPRAGGCNPLPPPEMEYEPFAGHPVR